MFSLDQIKAMNENLPPRFIVDPRILTLRMFKQQLVATPDNPRWFRNDTEGRWEVVIQHEFQVPYDVVPREAPEVPEQ